MLQQAVPASSSGCSMDVAVSRAGIFLTLSPPAAAAASSGAAAGLSCGAAGLVAAMRQQGQAFEGMQQQQVQRAGLPFIWVAGIGERVVPGGRAPSDSPRCCVPGCPGGHG